VILLKLGVYESRKKQVMAVTPLTSTQNALKANYGRNRGYEDLPSLRAKA
jgi:hypothetical protein